MTERVKSGQKRFVLKSLLGKKLVKEAYLYVEGAKWILDFNNGEKISYTFISGNKDNPLCGINSVDNFNDNCEICITKNGDDAIIQFKYDKKTLSYSGYYDK